MPSYLHVKTIGDQDATDENDPAFVLREIAHSPKLVTAARSCRCRRFGEAGTCAHVWALSILLRLAADADGGNHE